MAKLLELFRHFLLLKALTRGRRGCSEFYHVCSYILHTPNPNLGVAFWCCCCSSFALREHVANGGRWYHTKYIQYYFWWPMFCSRKQWQRHLGAFACMVSYLVDLTTDRGKVFPFRLPLLLLLGWLVHSMLRCTMDERRPKGPFPDATSTQKQHSRRNGNERGVGPCRWLGKM